MRSSRRYQGFTLIELLIVVAIIAILAAIAVPNFLEAQTRAKVSRARSDQRTIATALEAYRVDATRYPPHLGSFGASIFTLNGYGNPRLSAWRGTPPFLTTPIAYLTAVLPDVFKSGRAANSGYTDPDIGRPWETGLPWDTAYIYQNIGLLAERGAPGFTGGGALLDYGQWRLFSVGPTSTYTRVGADSVPPAALPLGWLYDPTNGTISTGMLVRTQVQPTVASSRQNP
jgi:type II secretion system protein G